MVGVVEVMARYIDADKLIDTLETLKLDSLFPQTPIIKILDVIELIKTQQTTDVVEVRHGYWEKEKLVMCDNYYLCSVCGKLHDQKYPFCNDCGAKMDGSEV